MNNPPQIDSIAAALEQQMEKQIEIKIKILTAAYDRSIAYTNLIILAGYAGIFTLWSSTKKFIPDTAIVLIALLLGISIFFFCFWEIYKMIYTSRDLRSWTNIMLKGYSPELFNLKIKENQAKVDKTNLRLYRHWYFILLITVPTGFGAALILFYNYIANLISLPYWPK